MPTGGTWTYSGNPATNSRDAVRFLIRDTVETAPLFSDQEIAWLLSQNGGHIYRAAAIAAEQLVSLFISSATTSSSTSIGSIKTMTVGALSITYTVASSVEQASEYRRIAADLRRLASIGYGAAIAPYAGGISIADQQSNEADADWKKPAFAIAMMDNPSATST